MAVSLNQNDVDRLLSEPSPHARAEVAAKLATELDKPQLSEAELNIAHEIIRAMARDVEVMVRQSLSYGLRHSSRLPHDVAVKLANDVEVVALPVLENSTVLTDEDFTAIIKNSSPSKQEAISRRPNISERVSDVLVSHAAESAVTSLMQNVSARISEQSLSKAIERFRGSTKVQEALVHREKLPPTIAEQLAVLVSERLQEHLVAHHELSETVAANIVFRSRERATLNVTGGIGDRELEKLVAQMHRNKRLTPSIVMRALCRGDMAFFEASMAIMADISLANARILIHDGGELGLKSICTKSQLPPQLFPLITVAIDAVHEAKSDGEEKDLERHRKRIVERILTQYNKPGTKNDIEYLLETALRPI